MEDKYDEKYVSVMQIVALIEGDAYGWTWIEVPLHL